MKILYTAFKGKNNSSLIITFPFIYVYPLFIINHLCAQYYIIK